jgi:PRP38 family
MCISLTLAYCLFLPEVLLTRCAALQVYYKVDNVEPWMSGNARGATSAFCLLVRLGQLKPTDEQVQQLLDHTDSPYIRAVGACCSAPSACIAKQQACRHVQQLSARTEESRVLGSLHALL